MCFALQLSQSVGVQTDTLHSAVNGFKDQLFMKYFLVSLQSHDLKSTVLVAMFVDLDTPLFERGACVC